MLKKFLFVILFSLSLSVFAENIQTYTAAESPKLEQVDFSITKTALPENQMENFFGFVIAGVVLAFGVAAFAAFANQNKEVLED